MLFKVQGFNPQSNYNCSNPKDGDKFLKNHICIKDSTEIFCSDDKKVCSSCDPGHAQSWTTFCQEKEWDDPRGPKRSVVDHKGNPVKWEVNADNPFKTDVYFTPGESFTICVEPYADAHANGVPLRVERPARTCVTETY